MLARGDEKFRAPDEIVSSAANQRTAFVIDHS